MGEAKRRGTFDQRKAQAITEGRERPEPVKKLKRPDHDGQADGLDMIFLSMLLASVGRRRRRH